MEVRDLRIREIFSTASKKTIELELETEKGIVRSSVPIGTSRGKNEVIFLPTSIVLKKFDEIKTHFIGKNFLNQEDVDETLKILDGSETFENLGGNLALGISSVFIKAFALEEGVNIFEYLSQRKKITLPKPLCNVIGGGKHGGGAEIQEFLLLPKKEESFKKSIEKIENAYLEIGELLKERDKSFLYSRNLESAWVTSLDTLQILDLLQEVCLRYELTIGVDVAASNFFHTDFYLLKNDRKTPEELLEFYLDLCKSYDILYIEDPFQEEDFESFSKLTESLKNVLVCGDDLYTTNPKRLKTGIEKKATNAVLVKPNQVGTITDALEFINMAKKNGMKVIVSHRSAETEDTLICHLASGLSCDFIKLGTSGERTIKINEMLRIEEMIKG